MSTFAELLDRGGALPEVEEGTHTGSLQLLVRPSQEPNGQWVRSTVQVDTAPDVPPRNPRRDGMRRFSPARRTSP